MSVAGISTDDDDKWSPDRSRNANPATGLYNAHFLATFPAHFFRFLCALSFHFFFFCSFIFVFLFFNVQNPTHAPFPLRFIFFRPLLTNHSMRACVCVCGCVVGGLREWGVAGASRSQSDGRWTHCPLSNGQLVYHSFSWATDMPMLRQRHLALGNAPGPPGPSTILTAPPTRCAVLPHVLIRSN